VLAVDAETGERRWRAAVGGQIRAPGIHDGTLHVGNFS
jgi:hypothetical protein